MSLTSNPGDGARSAGPLRARSRARRRALSPRLERATGGLMRRAYRRPYSLGQTLIIFALTFTVLIGILGLAIDTVRIYDMYARMQRAAEAGALAGVIYMPNYYTATLPYSPGDSAICRSMAEIVKNHFGSLCSPETAVISSATACPATVSSVEVAVCQVANKPDDLAVFITENLNLAFMSALGFGPVTITVKAQAEYLPPVQIATNNPSSGGAANWGGLGECTSYVNPPVRIDCDDTLRSFAANIAGPAELKGAGDAFVNCEEGPSYVAAADPPETGALTTTYNGFPTNHPQYNTSAVDPSHCGTGNTDQQSFTGPMTVGTTHPGGYAYYVHINQAGSSLWVYNAPFSPASVTNCTNEYPLDTFRWYCNGNTPIVPSGYFPGSQYSTLGFQDPSLYFAVTYSIYQIPALGNPGAGTLMGTFTALPYDGMNGNGCTYPALEQLPSAAYSIAGGACVNPKCDYAWCPVGNQTGDATIPAAISLPAGDYRIMVESTSYTQPTNFALGWGQHIYNFKVCPAGTTQSHVPTCYTDNSNPPGVIGGWSSASMLFVNTIEDACEICITSNFPPGLSEFPLGTVPTQYAGLTLDVKFFNPGGEPWSNQPGGNVGIAVVPPVTGVADPCVATPQSLAGYTFTFPSWERSGTADQIDSTSPPIPILFASKNGDQLYDGLWTDIFVKVPTNYTVGQWTLCTWATSRQLSKDDAYSEQTMTVKVTALGQSPVHLVSQP